ncbi:threonine/homoserine/homoserine lactone efflux protein [Paenibacillus anaericanus]|uniref:LysE family translocator n=1 Tax=Paenibacillus anaericanus TaxID=170367 RepID=A0A3S1ELG2_9BACL|nr:LysE family transporter [Paenibacillus anaericanus]MDQ0087727.1 threonine/homoserine/homoserine lactone efflux protein [Paenibacillus anaericanus]RUT48086.1 LysE family translocator [Paenibacillus anaericanus]
MDPNTILKGILLGLSIAAPMGPISMVCIRSTLSGGRGAGYAAGFGVATADACYGVIAGLGVTAASSFLLQYLDFIRLCGGIFLCYLGLSTFFRKTTQSIESSEQHLLGSFASTFLLTLANPMTIVSFASIFAATGFTVPNSGGTQIMGLVSGVFLGSALWWILLSMGVSLFRKTLLSPYSLRLINRLSAVILIGFGIWTLLQITR